MSNHSQALLTAWDTFLDQLAARLEHETDDRIRADIAALFGYARIAQLAGRQWTRYINRLCGPVGGSRVKSCQRCINGHRKCTHMVEDTVVIEPAPGYALPTFGRKARIIVDDDTWQYMQSRHILYTDVVRA